jgi:hypothetical protein
VKRVVFNAICFDFLNLILLSSGIHFLSGPFFFCSGQAELRKHVFMVIDEVEGDGASRGNEKIKALTESAEGW